MMLSTAIKLLGTTMEIGTRLTPTKPMELDGTENTKETPIANAHENDGTGQAPYRST
jgi:hypothetical protein